jgi:hypothetical protein
MKKLIAAFLVIVAVGSSTISFGQTYPQLLEKNFIKSVSTAFDENSEAYLEVVFDDNTNFLFIASKCGIPNTNASKYFDRLLALVLSAKNSGSKVQIQAVTPISIYGMTNRNAFNVIWVQ